MKKIILATSIFIISCVATSWATAPHDKITGQYDRPSYSLIIVNSEGHSSDIKKWLKTYTPDNKFDYNYIKTQTIHHRYSNENKYFSELRNTIEKTFSKEKVGQQIISYIFNRQADGEMNDLIVKQRGLYSASNDQENNATATAIGHSLLEDYGYTLLEKSYIVVIEFFDYKSEDGTMSAKARCLLYRMKLSDELLNDVIFGQTWVDADDSTESRKAKNQIFNDVEFEFELCGYFHETGYDSAMMEDNKDYMQDIYNQLYKDTLYKLGEHVEEFMVQTPLIATEPLQAKIGKKESLKNGDRYDTYEHVKDKDGNLKVVRRGILRATTIPDNRVDNNLSSEFIQVAGRQQNAGYILKQRNDQKMLVTPYYRWGAMEGYGINYDILSSIETKGKTFYGGLYLNWRNYEMEKLGASPELHDYAKWYAWALGVRIVRTHRFMRYFEAGFNLNIGADLITKQIRDEDGEVDKELSLSGSRFAPTFGTHLKINVWYPFHISLGVDYTCLFGAGARQDDPESDGYQYYILYNDLKSLNIHRGGLGCSVGVTYLF
ncbi:MAG: hypothetical protein R3Y08_05360 [Rikenellaceae bacterium]